MAAPDELFFCQRGHLCYVISGEAWESKGRRACPCGEEKIASRFSYGETQDGILYPLEGGVDVTPIKRIGYETLRIRIPEAIDAGGKPIEAYRDCQYEVWDVSQLFASPSQQ